MIDPVIIGDAAQSGKDTVTYLSMGGAFGAISAAGYNFWRKLKHDTYDDSRTKKVDDWTDGLLERVKELESRIDLIAQDRNAAVIEAAKLLSALSTEKNRADKLELEVHELRMIVDELKDAKLETRNLLAKIQSAYTELVAENTEFRAKLGLPEPAWKSFSHLEA